MLTIITMTRATIAVTAVLERNSRGTHKRNGHDSCTVPSMIGNLLAETLNRTKFESQGPTVGDTDDDGDKAGSV